MLSITLSILICLPCTITQPIIDSPVINQGIIIILPAPPPNPNPPPEET